MSSSSFELSVRPSTKPFNQQRDSGALLRTGEKMEEPLGFIRREGQLRRSGAEGGRGEEGFCLLILPLS